MVWGEFPASKHYNSINSWLKSVKIKLIYISRININGGDEMIKYVFPQSTCCFTQQNFIKIGLPCIHHQLLHISENESSCVIMKFFLFFFVWGWDFTLTINRKDSKWLIGVYNHYWINQQKWLRDLHVTTFYI